MRALLLVILLSGCTHKVSWLQPEAGMTPEQTQGVQSGFQRHEEILKQVIQSLTEVREKLKMNPKEGSKQ